MDRNRILLSIFDSSVALHKSPESQMQVSLCHLILLLDEIGALNASSFCIPLDSEKSNTVSIVNSVLSGAFSYPPSFTCNLADLKNICVIGILLFRL